MNSVYGVFCLTLAATFIGCAEGNCRSHKPETDEKTAVAAAATVSAVSQSHISVFKYDGSRQCAMEAGTALGEMQKELKGILVYSSVNKADKLMHIQNCGSPTGKANVYEIDRTQLEAAKKAGFREWTFD